MNNADNFMEVFESNLNGLKCVWPFLYTDSDIKHAIIIFREKLETNTFLICGSMIKKTCDDLGIECSKAAITQYLNDYTHVPTIDVYA